MLSYYYYLDIMSYFNDNNFKVIGFVVFISLVAFAKLKILFFYIFGICYYYVSKINSILNDYIKPYYYNSFMVATMLITVAMATLLISVIY